MSCLHNLFWLVIKASASSFYNLGSMTDDNVSLIGEMNIKQVPYFIPTFLKLTDHFLVILTGNFSKTGMDHFAKGPV